MDEIGEKHMFGGKGEGRGAVRQGEPCASIAGSTLVQRKSGPRGDGRSGGRKSEKDTGKKEGWGRGG